MTNKQQIIDGCDVSGDKFVLNCRCEKLKAKEKECEELQKYHNKCCEEFEKEKKEWLKKYNQVSRYFYDGKYCDKEHCSLLQAKEEECERLKNKLNPKLKNAHCTYFEGQTGLCKAKEFTRCNPVGCKLYTIDELSTIVELQQQLDKVIKENKEIKTCYKNNLALLDKEEVNTTKLVNKVMKLEKTLTEIKEIAEPKIVHGLTDMEYVNIYSKTMEQILQKISEVIE